MTSPAYDRWRDDQATHIPVGCRVEQVEVAAGLGALRSRLHQRGTVAGRGTTRLLVHFDGESAGVSIRPHLVRVLETDPPLSTGRVIEALEQLRGLLPAIGDEHAR